MANAAKQIREDLIGEVWTLDKDGNSVVLVAGDKIPTGVSVEDDLLEGSKSTEGDED